MVDIGHDLEMAGEDPMDDRSDIEEFGEDEDDDKSEDYMAELPVEVRKRILALKKLQLEVTKIESKFYKEMHALEEKYLSLYKPYFEKRNLITSGQYEPTPEECEFPGIEELLKNMNDISINKDSGDKNEPANTPVAGIPEFWLKIFTNVDLLADMLEEGDIPILKHLMDIKVETTNDPMGFKLYFHFAPNEYFSNTVLTKVYVMKCEVDPEDPFSFEGTEIIKCFGCPIDWNKGKNVTVKVIKKKQKHKQSGSIRTVNKTISAPSFFNFFSPPEFPENNTEELDEDTQARLTNDFQVGQYIRENIIPHAVLFYTGEALDDEDGFDDDDEDEEEEDDEEDLEDEEDDDDEKNSPRYQHGGM